MTNRSITVLGVALVLALVAGCAGNYAGNGVSASIPSDRPLFSGTWRGSAYEVGGSASGSSSAFYGPEYSLRITDDGTWTLTERRGDAAVEYSGTSKASGNRIILSEAGGMRSISLVQSDNRLYGLTNLNSRTIVIELTRGE